MTGPRRRLLIVAYYFPPIGGIGSIRVARFAQHLAELGWDATVIAPRDTPHALDSTVEFPEENVVRARSLELSRLGRVVPGGPQAPDVAAAPRRGAKAALRDFAHRYVFYPDGQIGWYPGAVTAGVRTLKHERFDAIFSSSNPMTAHLVGRTLARRASLPWVAEFRDPWCDRLPVDHPYRRHAARLMKRLGQEATRVVVPTPGMASHYGQAWDREIALIPNGHDIEAQRASPATETTITHIGTYYPELQDFTALWEAVAGMGTDSARPRIRFVGEMPGEVRAELRNHGLDDRAEATGFVPHSEAMEGMFSSSVLVASGFRGDDPADFGVIPAKLFEYLATPLPILYFGRSDDDAGQLLLTQPGCWVIDRRDAGAAAEALRAALASPPVQRDVSRFSRRSRARDLASVLEQAVASR